MLFPRPATIDSVVLQQQILFRRRAARRGFCPGHAARVEDARWSSDGKAIFFLANTGVRSELFGSTDHRKVGATHLRDHELRDWMYQPGTVGTCSRSTSRESGDIWVLGSRRAAPVRVTRVSTTSPATSSCRARKRSAGSVRRGVGRGAALLSHRYVAGKRTRSRYRPTVGDGIDKFGFGHRDLLITTTRLTGGSPCSAELRAAPERRRVPARHGGHTPNAHLES